MAQDLGEAVLKLTTDTSSMKSGLAEAQNLLEDFLTIEAVKEVVALGKEMLDSFAEAQRAFVTLQFTTGQSANELHRWAEEMQGVTEFTHEQIETNIPLLAGMGMTESKMKEVMTAAMNLSSVYGVSLDQAVRGLASSLENGTVGMLSRYIPTLRSFTEEQLKNGAAIQWTAEKYTGAAQAVGESVAGIQARMTHLMEEQKEKIGAQIAAVYVSIMKFTDIIDKIGNVAAVAVGILVKLLVTNQMLFVDFWRFIIDGFKTLGGLLQNLWKDILHPEKWLKDAEDAFMKMVNHVKDYAIEMKDVWIAQPPVVVAAMKHAADDIGARWVAMGTVLDQRAKAFADRWVAMGTAMQGVSAKVETKWTGSMEGIGQGIDDMKWQWDEALQEMQDKYGAYINFGANLTRGFAEEIGTALGAGTLSWKTFGEAGLHALGKIISAIGDQLAALAAADVVKALAASSSIFTAWAAPGYWSAAAIEGAGAAAAWAAGAALSAIKLKAGGDFVVPPGYEDDGMPIRVGSGEHVSVTPAGAGGDMQHIIVNLDSRPILDAVTRGSRNKKVLITARSVVP